MGEHLQGTGFQVGNVHIGRNLAVVAGPCVIESREHLLALASQIMEVTRRLGVPWILKASFDKANRTSIRSYRGPGIDKGLEYLGEVKAKLGVPVLTDIHEPWQAKTAATVVDVLQIPAFLCRQTDLLVAAAETGLAVNIKKGQFLSPWEMERVIEKVTSTGNRRVILTERGTCFGYNDLVVDFRSIDVLLRTGYPVLFDATHSVQRPGLIGDRSGGDRSFVPVLCRCSVAAGVQGLFLEVHDRPDQALSDPATSIPLDLFESILSSCLKIRKALGQGGEADEKYMEGNSENGS